MIIGLLVTGIVKAGDLYRSSQLMSARIHTKNSPVLNIKGLSYWYEPVLEDSFLTEDGLSGDSIEDGDAIKTWLDQNNLRVKRHNSVQMTANRQPKITKISLTVLFRLLDLMVMMAWYQAMFLSLVKI